MKKILATFMALASFTLAQAIIAPRTPFTVRQPDGTTITLVNHGDEFCHWTTTTDGIKVRQGVDGYWKPGQDAVQTAAAVQRRSRAQQMQTAAAESSISMGDKHFLVLLIEFDDLSFTLPDANGAFTRMLNEPEYSENGGTGSVKDFYFTNSSGQFTPTFDVIGPIKIPQGYAHYGHNTPSGDDAAPDEALFDACNLIDDSVDFSQYDHDKDGFVDNVFFFYAGHNEAEGGGGDTIWPHAWALFRYEAKYDGVRVWSYACASEYKGFSGKMMCGIGTFTHEFAHVLGLPDFYDTNYEQYGSAQTLGNFSTMDGGCYNNGSRTPPLFNAVERNILGWMDEPEEFSATDDYLLSPIIDNKAYRVPTSTPGEYFIFEMRDGKGWDAPLPAGMLLYHQDRSNTKVGYYTAAELWDSMYGINEYGSHPCFYIVPSAGAISPENRAVYPGVRQVTSIEPIDWNGIKNPFSLSNIELVDDKAAFHVKADPSRVVRGDIRDTLGAPVQGVSIIARRTGTGPQVMATAPGYGTTSGMDGKYILYLTTENSDGLFALSAMASGYKAASIRMDLSTQLFATWDIVLEPSGEADANALAAIGYNTISLPVNAAGGDVFPLNLNAAEGNDPLSVAWYYDEVQVQGDSIVLAKGTHTLKAVQTFPDRTEELYSEFSVND